MYSIRESRTIAACEWSYEDPNGDPPWGILRRYEWPWQVRLGKRLDSTTSNRIANISIIQSDCTTSRMSAYTRGASAGAMLQGEGAIDRGGKRSRRECACDGLTSCYTILIPYHQSADPLHLTLSRYAATYTVNFMTWWNFSELAAMYLIQIIYSWVWSRRQMYLVLLLISSS